MRLDYILSDDELIYLIKQNNKEAERLLFSFYDTKLRGMLEKRENLVVYNIDDDILHNIYRETIYEAINGYNSTMGSFYTYVMGLLYYKVIANYRKTISKSELEDPVDFNDRLNILEDVDSNNFSINFDYHLALVKLKEYRIEFYQAVCYWVKGHTFKEIASLMNVNVKRANYLVKCGIDWLKNRFVL